MTTFYPEGWLCESSKRTGFTESQICDARYTGAILEAPAVMCDNEHNLIAELGCMKGIIPRNEGAIGISEGAVRDIALISRVGKTVTFTVSDVCTDKNGIKTALLSRRAAQEKCKAEYIRGLRAGDIINAKVTHLESFGAFCDIGCGIAALLPIDSVSVSRVSHPSDRLKVGDNIHVAVKQVCNDGRITLTLKELLGTWEENAAMFSAGQTVSGIVRSVEEYGVFIELSPNLAGLAEPKDGIAVGDRASVYIKSIIPDKMKVKLIIIDSFEDNNTDELKYFISAGRLTSWRYSPKESPKQIATDFI